MDTQDSIINEDKNTNMFKSNLVPNINTTGDADMENSLPHHFVKSMNDNEINNKVMLQHSD